MKNYLLLFYFFCFVQLSIIHPIKAQEENPADSLDISEKTVNLLYDIKPVKYITGSVSQISGDKVANVAGANRLNTLAGRMTGISYIDMDGLPGVESSIVRIRGQHTFRGDRNPLILIDGRVDDYTVVDPYDIESITFLKDAATLAMYGLRSSKGIIMINTKKGTEGRAVVSLNTETSFSQPTRMPKFLDSYNYAVLYNEAQLNDNPNTTPMYDNTALEGYRTGSDPYKYPNVNWVDEFLKKNYILTRTNINVRGGNKVAKYYFAANYLYNSGVFNVDKDINTYNTNTTYHVMNVHANVELNIGKNLLVSTDIRGKKEKRNSPLGYNADFGNLITTHLYSLPFNVHPIKNRDGSIAGTNTRQNNPFGLLNYSGYSVWERASLSSYVNASYDLSDLLKGLSIEGRAGFNTFTDYSINRTKGFAVYEELEDGTYRQYGQDGTLSNSGSYRQVFRNYDHYIGLRYSGDFGKHNMDVLFMYDRQQVMNAQSTQKAQNFQGPKGSLSYRYNDTYLVDFVFSYQGNEHYPKKDRYGFFPAVAAGWIISNESFMDNAGFIDFLKIRGSHGLTGNHVDTYYAWLSSFSSSGTTNYFFGVNPTSQSGYTESQVANQGITWEKCLKTNIGLDFSLLQNRLSGFADYFFEKTKDILVQNAFSAMFGATGVYAPVGKFENKGYEFELGWNDRIRDFGYFIRLNYSFAKNKIIYQDEEYREYPWLYRTGHPVDSRFGYVFDRFFTENDDIAALPDQSLLGNQQNPGDLKYKDLNNDGVINPDDHTMIGKPHLATTNYGISFGVQYRGFDANVLFHGVQGGSKYLSGYTYRDFPNQTGNVLEHHLDRWQPGDGQSAGYPRLSLTNNNNDATSSYWIRDNSFLRLKYIEIGYTVPTHISRKIGMSKARIFVNGNNLYCWDKIEMIDPEIQENGLDFPIQRTFSVGLNISF